MRYGLITAKDIETLEKTLALVKMSFKEIRTLEIGVHEGNTFKEIIEYFKDVEHSHIGIDNDRDAVTIKETVERGSITKGNSIEIYHNFPDGGFHFIFLDANHNLFFTTADFLLYRNKVAIGGYFAFHDTSPHIKPFTDYQGIGDKGLAHNYISCREAIKNLGLLDNKFHGWSLVFDEYDETSPTGGMAVFKRTK